VKSARVVATVLILAVIAFLIWFFVLRPSPNSGLLTIYFTKLDGTSLGTWSISQRAMEQGETRAEYLQYEAMYSAVQEVAGPPSDVAAIRFPAGTHVNAVTLDGNTANVDVSSEVTRQSGTFGEDGEFKALVYTLTALPGIDAVQVTVAGQRLQTLPNGNLELDAPLHRSDW